MQPANLKRLTRKEQFKKRRFLSSRFRERSRVKFTHILKLSTSHAKF